jgi:hypothetical protein
MSGKHLYFHIDWIDYRRILRAAILDNERPVTMTDSRVIDTFMTDVRASGQWHDFSAAELRQWIADGYTPSNTIDVPMLPPVQDKRRMRFIDDGDEFHADLAMSGADYYTSSMTQRKHVPAINIEAGIMFSGSTSGRIVNEYTMWLAQVCYSLETVGISCELTIDFPSWSGVNDSHSRSGVGTCYHQVVRVKKASEGVGFDSWSAMVSPAALRNFGFGLIDMHADSLGLKPSPTKGRGMQDRREWKVEYHSDRKTLVIENNYMGPTSFPEASMTTQLVEAIQSLRDSQ